MSAAPVRPEDIHASLWRASQLARGRWMTLDTGYPALGAQMPGGGWPLGALVELLVQQGGVGEMRLLAPALSPLKRPIALIQPPHVPNALGFSYIGMQPERLIHLNTPKTADALWSAEQILRAGSCGALLYWAQHVQASSLRRLHLAAQTSSTLFIMLRPLAAAQDASPAVLRLTVRPAAEGVSVEIIKRQGPSHSGILSIELQPTPVLLSKHGRTARRPLSPVAAKSLGMFDLTQRNEAPLNVK